MAQDHAPKGLNVGSNNAKDIHVPYGSTQLAFSLGAAFCFRRTLFTEITFLRAVIRFHALLLPTFSPYGTALVQFLSPSKFPASASGRISTL